MFSSLGDAIDKNVTSDEERLILRNELKKMEADFTVKMEEFNSKRNEGQVQINVEEAKSGSLFKSGWRPAIGWIGVFGLGYHYILFPMLQWVANIWLPDIDTPVLDSEGLMALVSALLGIGGYRTYEKFKGVTK